MRVRPATGADLEQVVALTRARRRRLAEWSPVYFNPSDHADDAHAGFLAHLLDADDHDTRVFVDDTDVLGFFRLVAQPAHVWVDDLCVASDESWSAAVAHLVDLTPGWVTCVSTHDATLATALAGVGAAVASTYHSRTLADLPPTPPAAAGSGAADSKPPPPHTFGGGAMDPATPGALVISRHDGGRLVGSPGITPPIYDPGGPTCVVDRIEGPDRPGLLHEAMRTAAARGDAQMIVVRGADDRDLHRFLATAGFEAQVNLFVANRGEEMSGH